MYLYYVSKLCIYISLPFFVFGLNAMLPAFRLTLVSNCIFIDIPGRKGEINGTDTEIWR